MTRKPEPLDLYTVERWHDDAEAAARARAGLRLCEERNRERWPAGWWIIPGALLGLGMVVMIVWWLA